MSRKTAALKPQLNRIRAWAQEGSTDAWIAHQLDTTADVIAEFRAEQSIGKSGPAPVLPITPDAIVEAMLAEEEAGTAPPKRRRTPAAEPIADAAEETADDAPAAAAPKRRRRTKADAATTEAAPESTPAETPAAPEATVDPGADADGEPTPRPRRRRRSAAERAAEAESATDSTEGAAADSDAGEAPAFVTDDDQAELTVGDETDGVPAATTRRRRRRGGRGRGSGNGGGSSGGGELRAQAIPGRVIVLGDAITSNATFREHWSDASAFTVEVSADAITLRRS